ncbi:MAG TPA: DUF559 domain-containing protein, partial [Steroidobacteraceae bacterium]|nr:DUF559 domain-containing protein [Steroidobacteraceae bacterium]
MSGKIMLHRARTLRRAQTEQEQQLWQCLRAKRFANFKFKRQYPLGNYIVDFICFKPRIIIELDGSQHTDSKDYDAERDAWFSSQGFRVLRIWNNQWMLERNDVLQMIWNELN